MTSDSRSRPGPTRFRGGLILVFTLIVGVGIASSRQSAFAGVQGAGDGNDPSAIDAAAVLAKPVNDAAGSKAFAVAEKGNKNWSKGNNNKNWGHYNNNWNKNWNKRAHVLNWNRKPYYGEFIGGIVLGSILAANGVGVVPYAPDPNLCWYWADPYMERGYWDYCY